VTLDAAIRSRSLYVAECRVRDTNDEFNLVFPFYLTEGTG